MPNVGGCSKLRTFIFYLITTLSLVVLLYSYVSSHYDSMSKFESLQFDIKLLANELTKLTQNNFNIDKNRNLNARDIPNDDDTMEIVESAVQKYTKKLVLELENTKNIVENLKNNLGSSQLPLSDKTGRTDYALESLGGQVISIGDTVPFKKYSILSLFGITSATNSPRHIIQPSMYPGECFGFKGEKGSVLIKLAGRVLIDSISIEHISEELSPSGNIKSAPNEFSVWGLKNLKDKDPYHFGSFSYKIDIQQPLQMFSFIRKLEYSFEYVEFKFLTNHGNPEFTCVYRIRVHGTLDNESKYNRIK